MRIGKSNKDNTMAKRKRTNNDLKYIHLKLKIDLQDNVILSLSSVSKIEWCVNIISSAGPFYVKNDIYIITLCIFLRNSLHKTPSKSDEK
jgi:hypothetical protein